MHVASCDPLTRKFDLIEPFRRPACSQIARTRRSLNNYISPWNCQSAMNGTQNGASPASSKHAQSLEELRQRISQDENVASQLRTGGEPGMLGTSGVDDQTLLRFLKAEKCVSLCILLDPCNLYTTTIHCMEGAVCCVLCTFSGTMSVRQSRG